jgi:hypothetical protein
MTDQCAARSRFNPASLKAGCLAASVFLLAISISGCAQGEPPIAIARVCLPQLSDVSQFKLLVRQWAKSSRLEYFDRSEDTKKELQAIGNPSPNHRSDGFILNIGSVGSDGLGVTASELGGQGYQVALGFSSGRNKSDTQRFIDAAISDLKRRWIVNLLNGKSGVEPMASCT